MREAMQGRHSCISTRASWLLGVLSLLTLLHLHGSLLSRAPYAGVQPTGSKAFIQMGSGSRENPKAPTRQDIPLQAPQQAHATAPPSIPGLIASWQEHAGIQQPLPHAGAADDPEQLTGLLARLKAKADSSFPAPKVSPQQSILPPSQPPSQTSSQSSDSQDRERLREYIKSADFQIRRFKLEQQQGRGIVMTAGGLARLGGAYLSLRVLREVLGSTMPVEVVYNGPKEYHDVLMPRIAAMSGVKLIDVSQIPAPLHLGNAQALTGWYVKAMSLYGATSFREVLLLDADNILLVPPEQLFDNPQWRQSGNLFWPDYTIGGEQGQKPTRAAFEKIGLPVPWDQKDGPHFRTVESGQVLLDRARHADVLEWLWYLDSHHDQFAKDLHGDKDTFEMAFMLANKTHEYQQVKVPAGQTLGYEKSTNTYHHRGMTQYLPDGRLAFHHRTAGGKLLNHCRDCNVTESTCRVVYVTAPLTPKQSVQCAQQGWVWKANDLVLDAWSSLNCTYTSHIHAVTAPAADGVTSTGAQTGNQLWPGITCTKSTDKLAVVSVHKLGQSASIMDAMFGFFLQLGANLTASDWY